MQWQSAHLKDVNQIPQSGLLRCVPLSDNIVPCLLVQPKETGIAISNISNSDKKFGHSELALFSEIPQQTDKRVYPS